MNQTAALDTNKGPERAGNGKKDIVAAAKSAGSEGPTSRLDVARNRVDAIIRGHEDAARRVADANGDQDKAQLRARANSGLILAHAELVCSIPDIVELHEGGKDGEIVRKALGLILDTKLDGRDCSNPIARVAARLLRSQIEAGGKKPSMGGIISAEPTTIDRAEDRISMLVGEAREAAGDGKISAGKRISLDRAVAVLASSGMELVVLKESSRNPELAREALNLIVAHSTEEARVLAAKAMLADMAG
jgi:hypothetical protein